MTLPDSKSEKHEAFQTERRIEKWMYVHELRALLDQLQPDDWLTPNQVNNLTIGRDDNDNIGIIDFAFTDLEFWGEVETK